MEDDQQFCLRWNNHQSTLVAVFDTLLEKGTLVDCTLAAEGKFLNAHKVVLSACSPYFEALLSRHYDKHPILILKDVKFQELRAMMDYMYRGEVNISQDQLGALLKAAESLQIKGLSDNKKEDTRKAPQAQTAPPPPRSPPPQQTLPKVQGLTIEQRHRDDSRDGSMSPGPRKKKRMRRKSEELDNHHDASNSSESHSLPPQNIPSTLPGNSEVPEQIETKQEIISRHKEEATSIQPSSNSSSQVPMIKEKLETHTELMLEPKAEYVEEMNEDSIEDLTLDDDDLSNMEQMDDGGAGPSHGGEGSSQGFGQWHMGNQSQDEVFLAAQEAVGAHRDSQDFEICKINKLEDIVIEPEVLENTHGNLLQIKFEELFVPDSETTVTDSICIESDSESESETQHDTNYALPTLLGPSFCYLCKKHISDIAQHLNETHKNNAEVAKILKLPKNSHKYVEGLRKIKRWGDFFYNCIVIKSQKGTLNIDHSRFKKLKKSSSYGPCPDCLEFMPKTEIVTHLKNQCPENQNGLIANRHPEIESRAVMYSLLTSSLEKDFAMLVKTLGSDQIAQICRNDSLILIYGNFLLSTFRSESNSSKEKELGSIRNSMRELGKVLQVIKAQSKHSKDIPTLSKYLQIKFFDKIIQAVCCASAVHLCQRKDTGLPPVVTKLGKSIRECVALERGKALREVNVKRNEKLVKFWNCMSEHWTSENLLREFIKTKEKTSVQTRKTKNRTSV